MPFLVHAGMTTASALLRLTALQLRTPSSNAIARVLAVSDTSEFNHVATYKKSMVRCLPAGDSLGCKDLFKYN